MSQPSRVCQALEVLRSRFVGSTERDEIQFHNMMLCSPPTGVRLRALSLTWNAGIYLLPVTKDLVSSEKVRISRSVVRTDEVKQAAMPESVKSNMDVCMPQISVPTRESISCCTPTPTVTLHLLRCFQSFESAVAYAIVTRTRLIASVYDCVTVVFGKRGYAERSTGWYCNDHLSCRASHHLLFPRAD